MKKKFHTKVVAILSSNKFFAASLLVFFLETCWVALSGLFPMAYDENTHLASIQLFAHRWFPFWSSQPVGVDNLTLAGRDPSYMFYYLLSFPFRVFTIFVGSLVAQVIFLRLFNVVFFGIGIYLYRKLFLMMGISKSISHFVLAIFILTPLVPFLAAQINYDNLLLPISALAFIYSYKIIVEYKAKKLLDIKKLLILSIIILFGSLVMFSFLPFMPICLGLVIFIFIRLAQKQGLAKTINKTKKSFSVMALPVKILLIGLFVLMGGLFLERYGVNAVRYKSLVPDCDQVLSIKACTSNGPWIRNYRSHQDKIKGLIKPVASDPISYTVRDWIPTMSYQLFFALNGQISSFKVGEPLILPEAAAIIFTILGILLVIRYQRYLQKIVGLRFFVLAALFYALTLWHRQYFAFLYNGYAVAVQTRYVIAFVPILCLVLVLAYNQFLKKKPWIKSALAAIAIFILLFQGGGPMVFILRSDRHWYWPNSVVIKANETAQKILRPFVIGS